MGLTTEPAVPEEQGAADAEVQDLRALLADSSDLAAVLDGEGRLTYLNRAGRRLLALPPGSLDASVLALAAPSDQSLLEREVFPALHLDGWWTGTLAVRAATGLEVPTRSTFRLHQEGKGPARLTWVARDITTERAVYERLHRKIFEDELTGLPHRSIFLDRLDLSLRRVEDSPEPVILLFVTLDRFKEKNDRFGREVGDALLRAVAQRLDSLRSPTDTVSRWGGDEFVFMCECDGREHLEPEELAERVRSSFDEPFSADDIEVFLSASVGMSVARPGELGTDQMLRQADAAGQMAKQRGGNQVHRFDEEMRARAMRRAEVEDALRGAAGRGELVMHFQPEVSLRTNQIVAVEALVRWQHPEWGLVAPGEFVPVAEGSSLILELGAWVLTAGMDQAARWRAAFGAVTPTVGINISARQFLQDDFVELVATTLEHTGADPGDVCLEITESVLMDDVDLTAATLQRLKALGVQLAIDDFGTGYSSLSYLRRFPVDILKVDQSFVSGLGYDPEDSAIVQAVVHMGRALHLTTVAEGVETAHHLIELRELDCDIAQGYHFARPRPAEAITRMLEAGSDWMRVTL